MSILLELSPDPDTLAGQIVTLMERYEREIKKAEPLFALDGRRLEEIARTLPYNQLHYDNLLQECKQLVKWLENQKARIEARLTKNYLQGQRAYGARETTTLIAGEKEMVEHNELILEAQLTQQRLGAIVEAFAQMGWMVSHITKLRVASIHDAVI